ncbi:non-hydrolyzing UDP-N-acetylglucosamine 2-epimerase [Bacillus sp. CGMCC 1.16607]|uniref:non-hydrolyzing UDP-N-acetylglucosamine 2-epimerase n=1 Tax=Bacillus sp. CGMCC 1.16607 TaxID=3351842 RepID=UPI003642F4F4
MTVFGTRPEIIRLSRIIERLDQVCEHVIVHTGQNYDKNLSDIFLEELGIRKPDYLLDTKSNTPMQQVGKILSGVEEIFLQEKPNALLILGDTNSALCSFVAKRLNIPVFHMEAGNRCFDDRVPEEVNRRIIDHSSDVLMPYTERSRENLLQEGISSNRVYVTGNPIFEVLEFYRDEIDQSDVLQKLEIEQQKYFLVTLHRTENVDISERLNQFINAFEQVYEKYNLPIICIVHPRMKSQLEKQNKNLLINGIIPIDPVGLFDFVKLEKNAFCVLSDSGTVQEECSIFQVPNVTLRDVTERPETLEVGSNFISSCNSSSILRGITVATSSRYDYSPPQEYLVRNVSEIVTKIVLSYWR